MATQPLSTLQSDYETVKLGLTYAGRDDTSLTGDGLRLTLDALGRIWQASQEAR